MGQSHSDQNIYITIEAGDTQSQELFDYNCKQNRVIANSLIKTNSYIVHDGEDILYEPEDSIFQPIFSLKVDYEQISMESTLINRKVLWRVLADKQAYHLQIGNIVKIGKMKMRLKQILQQEKENTEKDFNFNESDYFSQSERSFVINQEDVQSKKSSEQGEKNCRICFQSNNKKENPLISLCKCRGSLKYIHFECLKDWVSNNSVIREHNNTLFYSYPQTKCQICKAYYEPYFTHNHRKYLLLDLSNAPNPPYAIFEEVQTESDEQNKRFSILLIGLGEDQITIGRNSSCNVVMKDISVSRNHCSLMYKNKTLLIKDNASKFGTLVMVQDQIEFNPKIGLNLQYQSKLIRFQQKQSLACCCCAQRDSYMLKLLTKKEIMIDLHQNL